MKATFRILPSGFVALMLATGVLSFAEVKTPAKRQEGLDDAKELLAIQPMTLPADLVNPFNPLAFAELMGTAVHPANPGTATTGTAETPTDKGGPRSTRSIVEEIAAGLKPSGYFIIGGEPTLVFGQKRVKAGGHITITFEGTEYTLEITSIERPNFTLRLNREEFTRPIK